VYSILSPEGFASILWKDASRAKEAADVMKMTAYDLKELGIINKIIKEPAGGAHKAPQMVADEIKRNLIAVIKG
jgi:acetyl-CoA carboxylase carboxyl transferase subunit alpha